MVSTAQRSCRPYLLSSGDRRDTSGGRGTGTGAARTRSSAREWISGSEGDPHVAIS